MTYSALTGEGVAELWAQVLLHRERLTQSGELAARRREQQVKWMWSDARGPRVLARLKSDAALRAKLPQIEAAVADGRLSATLAVDEIATALDL